MLVVVAPDALNGAYLQAPLDRRHGLAKASPRAPATRGREAIGVDLAFGGKSSIIQMAVTNEERLHHGCV